MKRVVLCLAVLVGCACVVAAQAPPAGAQAPAPSANPLSAEVKQAADRVAGNLAVQLRLKGIVPPSSEGGPMK